MAYPIATNDVIALTFQCSQDLQTVMSVFHYQYIGPTTIADGAAALDTLLSNQFEPGSLLDKYLLACNADLKVTNINAQLVAPGRFAKLSQLPAVGYSQGRIAGTPLPSSTAVAITKRGDSANRHSVGTLHMGGVDSASVADSVLTEAGKLLYAAVAGTLYFNIQANVDESFRPIIFNRAGPTSSVRVTAATKQNNVRTMRRRVVGRGI